MKLRNEIRVGEHSDDAIFWVRAGSRAATTVARVAVIACIASLVAQRSGLISFIAVAVVAAYSLAVVLLLYLRCGIWLQDTEVRVRAAFITGHAAPGQIVGVGVLYSSGVRAFTGRYRQIALLRGTGQWLFSTGVWGTTEVIESTAARMSEITGWPIASCPDKEDAKSSLMQGAA
jgi:hypothetical protein